MGVNEEGQEKMEPHHEERRPSYNPQDPSGNPSYKIFSHSSRAVCAVEFFHWVGVSRFKKITSPGIMDCTELLMVTSSSPSRR